MAVQLLFYGTLRKYLQPGNVGDNSLLHPYTYNITVSELLDEIGIPSKNVSFVMVNKTRYKMNMPLYDGDCIEIFPRTMTS